MPRMGRQDSECSTAPLDPYKTDYRESPRTAGNVCLVIVCVVLLLFSLAIGVWLVCTWLSFSQEIEELKREYQKVDGRRGWETSGENISALVDEALQQYLAERDRDHVEVGPPLPSRWASGRDRPMAHLTGNPEPNHYPKREENEVIKIRTWETDQGLATLANGMEYHRGNIIIPTDGLYYVYSQLSYRFRNDLPEDSDGNEEKVFQIIHYTYRKNSYPEAKQIMKTAKSTCWSKRVEFGLYTSFQGGVFQLEKGDRIWVSVSNAPLICFEETSSFFGAFMLY